ncbi:MAG: SPOR domain-containing protein, partial [Chlorobiaceae bacterium]|nr:SPOR domain-containing protein [Chlorobiaceae bacterium]
APAPKLATAAKPEAPATSTPAIAKAKVATSSMYTLQFGSFDNPLNADLLAALLPKSAQTSIVEVDGYYKVRLKKKFASRDNALAYGRSLPIQSFVVTTQP